MGSIKDSKNKKKINDYLIFIDTNILLDFYIKYSEQTSVELLNNIDKIKDRLILSSQLEMEFKRNRQKKIIDEINKLEESKLGFINYPRFMTNYEKNKEISNKINDINKDHLEIVNKALNILENPIDFDNIYKSFNNIFKHNSIYNLTKDHDDYLDTIKLAKDRFYLGNPPRKNNDINWGDSIHWEWIINCLIRSKKNLIIITRDSDFGYTLNKKVYLNDMLRSELIERVSDKIEIIIVDNLSEAFNLVDISVSIEVIEEENKFVDYNKLYEEFSLISSSNLFNLFGVNNNNTLNQLTHLVGNNNLQDIYNSQFFIHDNQLNQIENSLSHIKRALGNSFSLDVNNNKTRGIDDQINSYSTELTKDKNFENNKSLKKNTKSKKKDDLDNL